MATAFFTVVGNAIFPGVGGAIGAAVGGIIDNALFAPKLPDQVGPRFSDARLTSSAYGGMVPIILGTGVAGGIIIDASDITTESHSSGGGGKDFLSPPTPKTTTFTHFADICVLIADATIGTYTLLQIYVNEQLIFDATPGASIQRPDWLQFEFYDGSQTEPDGTFEALRGANDVPAYTNDCYIVFRKFRLDEFGLSDRIALQFKFVVSLNGTEGPDEETIDTTDFESTSTEIVDISHSPYPDLMIVGLETSAGTSAQTHTVLGVDPYTRAVVWKREATANANEGRVVDIVSGSIPIFALGVQVNIPSAQIIYPVTHGSTETEFIEIADAATGAVRVRATLSDEFPPAWMVAPYADNMIIYRRRVTDSGATDPRRMSWGGMNYGELFTGNPWTDSSPIDAPSGYDWNNVRPTADGKGLMLFTFDADPSGDSAFLIVDDEDMRTTAPSLSGYTPTVFTGSTNVLQTVYDPTQDAFWALLDRTADTDMDLVKISTDGTIAETWNCNTDLGITGTSTGFGDLHIGIDTTNGRLVFGRGSNYHSVSTAAPDINVKTYTKSNGSIADGGAFHPHTGRWYTAMDETLHIVQLEAATGGGTSLQTVCEKIALYGDTHLVSGDLDFSALSSTTVAGYVLGRQMSKAVALNQLMSAYQFDIVSRSGILTAVLRGSTSSAVTLDEDTIGAHIRGTQPPEPLTISVAAPESLPRVLHFKYINPDQNWEPGSQSALRLASGDGLGTTETVDTALSFTDDDAAKIADILLHMRHIESHVYETRTMPSTIGTVRPAELVTIDYDNSTYTARVDSADIVDGFIVDATLKRQDTTIYESFAVGGAVRNPTREVNALGATVIIPMQLPALHESHYDAGYYVAAYSYTPTWPGAEIYRSTDDANYVAVAAAPTSALVGVVASITGTPKADRWDSNASIEISLVNTGTLTSATLSEIAADPQLNGFALGRDGRWVVGRFIDASQGADENWTLSGLLLGLGGTEQNVGSLAVNDVFVLLTPSTIHRVSLATTNLGSVDYLKGVTVGRRVDLAPAVTITSTGEALKPYAPHNLHAVFSGDITLTWTRRDKRPTRGFWQAPMSESTEAYRVQILDSSYNVVRTLADVSSETATYTSAMQTTDFGSARNYLRWQVAQVSAEVGVGPYSRDESGTRVSWENFILGFSPTAALRFNEAVGAGTLEDFSGNNNDATNPDLYSLLRIPGPFNDFGIDMSEAGTFGETLDFGTVAAMNNINSGDFSLVVWFEAKTGYANADLAIFMNQAQGVDINFVDDSGSLQLITVVNYDTTDARFYSSDFTVVAGTRHLIVVTHDSSARTSKIYFDGTEVSSYDLSTTGAGTAVNGTAATTIGASSRTDSIVYEWALIPSELSSSQVSDTYDKLSE